MWQRQIKVADKVANQMTLRWGDYIGLSGWAQCIARVLVTGRRKQSEISQGMAACEGPDLLLLPSKVEEGDHKPSNMGGF